MTHYTIENVSAALGSAHPEWKWQSNALQATFIFPDFKAAFTFMTQVAAVAERLQHHPDWQNSYNTVNVQLFTHDQNAVTDLDISLAKEMSALAKTLI
jgi:4a-hydroxytetrahydrobiopterin dehydratase